MNHNRKKLTSDESMMLILYFHEDRSGTIASLQKMGKYLTAEETKLANLTNTLTDKLKEMTDEEFLQLDPIRNMRN